MSNVPLQKTLFISDLAEGQQLRDLFLVSRKNLAETKNGKPYLALTLMDRSGTIEARIWDNAAHFDSRLETGQVIAIEGQVKAFRDQLQLNIASAAPLAEDECQLSHFIPASKRSTRTMKEELAGFIGEIADPHLHRLLAEIFQGEVLKQFTLAPAAKLMHHAYLGGLLEHTLSVAGLAGRLAGHYPALDRDLLMAGALLHDLGKIREFSYTSVPFEYTDSGRLIGHLVLGSEMIRRQAEALDGFPPERLDQLLHLVLSHHGQHEFGAPCLPMTAEALLLHHLDDIDAKMNYIERLSEQVEPGTYQWSDYQRPLERFLLLRGGDAAREQQPSHGSPSSDNTAAREKNAPRQEEQPSGRQGKLF